MDIDKRFEIDLVCCVDEAFKKIKKQKYDVIVSDYEMPQKNGLDFLKELKEQKSRLSFILFTGKGREEVAIKALNLGADGYFDKQGSPETVFGELAHGIRMIKQRKEAESALHETQILMNSIINSTKDMIWSVSADGFRLLTFNKALSDYFLNTQNLRLKTGMSLKEIMPTEQLVKKWIELNKRTLREGSLSLEYVTSKDPRVLELTFNVLKKREKPFGIAVFARDITERKRIEEALKLSEERLRHLS
jgi:PAS domain S-box-containing protein